MPTCPECHRRFDLTDETDADEWAHGHDCEEPEWPISGPVSFESSNVGAALLEMAGDE